MITPRWKPGRQIWSRYFAALLTVVIVTGTELAALEPVVDGASAKANSGGKGKAAAPEKKKEAPPRSPKYREFADALAELGAQIDEGGTFPPTSEPAGIAARLFFRLQTLPPDERFELLRDWTMPADGRESIRMLIVVIPDAPPPAAFLPEKLPNLDDPVISTAALLVEAARDAGKFTEFAETVDRLVSLDVQGATLFQHLVDRIRNSKGGLVEAKITQLLDKDEMERQLQHAQQSANFQLVVWFYRARALAELERAAGARLKPVPDPGLKHWVPVDLRTAASGNQFGSTSWWLALDDRIGHVCSPWVDHLVFAYPLTGAFEISCEPFNDFWAEANVGFGGVMFEAWNQGSNSNQTYPINIHEVVGGPRPVGALGQFQQMTLRVLPGHLQVLANGNSIFEENSLSPSSPFLVLRTTWLSAFRNLKIVGRPVIPREITLLTGSRMVGWMSSFYADSQPPDLTVRHKQPDGKTAPPPSSDPEAFDWSVGDGTLCGRRTKDLAPRAAQTGFHHGESWLYFHRPLRDGERIRYEFFYQPGNEAIAVHPTIDRMAFLLEPAGVRLHWLTANRVKDFTPAAGWIATDNAIDEPLSRRGPASLPLIANDWNSAALELRDGFVRLELNGQLVCERRIDPDCGTRFGFYHDRAKSSVRVRNVVLSGDWPEWSEKLAGNLLERREKISREDDDAIRAILTPRLTAQ